MLGDDKKFELLLQESDHIHDTIQKSLDELNKLVGFIFPAVTGLFMLMTESDAFDSKHRSDASAVFCSISSLIVAAFNVVWMQLLTHASYKYGELMPQLYQLTGRTGKNYGQFATRHGILKPMLGALALQCILLPISYSALPAATDSTTFRLAAIITLAVAMLTTITSWPVALYTMHYVRNQKSLDSP